VHTFGGESDVRVFVDMVDEFTVAGPGDKKKETETAQGEAGF
jgi:hypothetical protein